MKQITFLLENILDKKKVATVDDLLIYSPKHENMDKLENLFKALIKRGLVLSPRKCQLFFFFFFRKKNYLHIGNIFTIQHKRNYY